MKCEMCEHLETDKGTFPCSMCENRPHDLCTRDRFEPKVLTVEEFIEKGYNHPVEKQKFLYEDMMMIANRFHRNGRLERDLELRNFIKAVMDHIPTNKNIVHSILLRGYQNLKPLNPK